VNAWPILRRLGIPATLFVPTGFPDADDGSFWWDRVWQAIQAQPAASTDTPAGPVNLTNEAGRRAAARALVDYYKRLPHDQAMAGVASLTEPLDGTERAAAPDGDVLGWEDLRQLAESGVDMAVHSRTHPLLTRVEPDRLDAELRGSREDLVRHLGPRAFGTVFAYPSGQHDSATRAALVRHGFELAFTTERGTNRIGDSDPLALRRINIGLRAGPDLVRAQVAFYTHRYRPGTV
jgi:peptidoglycan/xylan/chitin deacetylase (PgdA/CDA1 family)